MRYLLLFSERIEDETHANGWAWTYPTIVGMFVTPGVTVQSRGVVQADLLDVRTGTVLFSVVEPMYVSGAKKLMIGAGRAHRDLQARASTEAAKRLALKVSAQTNALVAFAEDSARPDRRAQKRIYSRRRSPSTIERSDEPTATADRDQGSFSTENSEAPLSPLSLAKAPTSFVLGTTKSASSVVGESGLPPIWVSRTLGLPSRTPSRWPVDEAGFIPSEVTSSSSRPEGQPMLQNASIALPFVRRRAASFGT